MSIIIIMCLKSADYLPHEYNYNVNFISGCTNDPYTEHPAIRPNKLTHKISPYNNGYFELTVEWSQVEFAGMVY